MFERLSRSWTLVKASASVLADDRKLLLFPLIASIAMLTVLGSFALPLLGWVFFSASTSTSAQAGNGGLYLLGFLFYLCQYFVIFFFNAALVSAALARLNGQTPSIRDSLAVAGSKWASILGYAAIAATVGLVLRMIQERLEFVGRLIAGLLGVGWTVATYLVVPVLVARDVGPLDAVNESAALVKRTWGENVAGQAGLGFAFGLLQFVLVLLGALLVIGAVNTGSVALIVLCVVVTLAALLMTFLVHGALSGIYAAALYRFAAQNGDTQGFDPGALRSAFLAKS